MQKVGAVAALFQAAVFVGLLAFNLVVFPSQGFATPDSLSDPKALSIAPSLAAASLLVATDAIWIVLVAVALYFRMRERAPALSAVGAIAAVAAAILFLAVGMIGLGVTRLAALSDQVAAENAFIALDIARSGLLDAARFAVGLWGILIGLAALSSKALPSGLAYLAIVWGIAFVPAFLLPPLGLVGVVLALVWLVWLAVLLLREPALTQRGASAVGSP